MYTILYTNQFEKSLKRCLKRGFDLSIIKTAIKLLELDGKLPPKYKAHKLTGNYSGFWECHLKADWLLVWMQNDDELTLLFTDTGSHSDLF
jgi:mRNA interferase YafQ